MSNRASSYSLAVWAASSRQARQRLSVKSLRQIGPSQGCPFYGVMQDRSPSRTDRKSRYEITAPSNTLCRCAKLSRCRRQGCHPQRGVAKLNAVRGFQGVDGR
jgi:hypothetical protein